MSILWCCCDPIPDTGVPLPPVTTLTTSRLPPQVTRIPDKIIPVGAAGEVDNALPIALPAIIPVDPVTMLDVASDIFPTQTFTIDRATASDWGWYFNTPGFAPVLDGFINGIGIVSFGVYGPSDDPFSIRKNVWLRYGSFPSLAQGATIIRARLLIGNSQPLGGFGSFCGAGPQNEPRAHEYNSDFCVFPSKTSRALLTAWAADDAPLPTTRQECEFAPRTTATVPLEFQTAPSFEGDSWWPTRGQVYADVTPIVQEIVNRPGFNSFSNNHIVFFLDENGSDYFADADPEVAWRISSWWQGDINDNFGLGLEINWST